MDFDPETAAIRFGAGLSPVLPPPASVRAMLDALAGPDRAAARLPVERLTEHVLPRQRRYDEARRALRAAVGSGDAEAEAAVRADLRAQRRSETARRARRLAAVLARLAAAEDGLRERLVHFWADHFTVEGRGNLWRLSVAAHVEEVIRPRVAGRFGDLLVAVVRSPMMLRYLDAVASLGPNSAAARAGRPGRGLNENLAREILELHALGADGPYAQADVTQLAELLTGLTVGPGGSRFAPRRAEPGTERILGADWGGDPAEAGHVDGFLRALAVHPATARHVCGRMAAHFLGPAPPEGVVAAMEAEWGATGGDLLAVTGAMLSRPEAWEVLPIEMRAPVAVGGRDRVREAQLARAPQRHQPVQPGMQRVEPVQVARALGRKAPPQGGEARIAHGRHEGQPVRRPAQQDHHQPRLARRGGHRHRRPERRRRGRAAQRQRGASGQGHAHLLWNSGLAKTSATPDTRSSAAPTAKRSAPPARRPSAAPARARGSGRSSASRPGAASAQRMRAACPDGVTQAAGSSGQPSGPGGSS